MRTGVHLPDPQPDAPLPDSPDRLVLHRQVEAWCAALDRCARKASRKRIHELRVATLRLQATLEFRLREQPLDAKGARAAKIWNKHGKRLRRALEPVREADAHLQKLSSLHEPVPGPDGRKPRCSSSCLLEIEELDSRIKQRRATAAESLQKEIEVH